MAEPREVSLEIGAAPVTSMGAREARRPEAPVTNTVTARLALFGVVPDAVQEDLGEPEAAEVVYDALGADEELWAAIYWTEDSVDLGGSPLSSGTFEVVDESLVVGDFCEVVFIDDASMHGYGECLADEKLTVAWSSNGSVTDVKTFRYRKMLVAP